MKEVKARVLEQGASLKDEDGHEWQVSILLFADDTLLIGDSEEKLQKLVTEFGNVCRDRKLSVNVGKSKVMRVGRERGVRELNVLLDGVQMEEVQAYRYLGVDMSADGMMDEEVRHRIVDAKKSAGALKKVWRERSLSMKAKVGMYEGIVEPSLLYGSEVWCLNVQNRRRMEAVEMNCLRSMCGVRRIDRISNAEIRRRCNKEMGVGNKIDQSVLRWFGHMERMENERLVKRVYVSKVEGRRARGRPRKRWLDGVQEALEKRGLDIQEVRDCVTDRSEWRNVCRGARRAAE